jgi:hypothetical protein
MAHISSLGSFETKTSTKKYWTQRGVCGKIINAPHGRATPGKRGKTFWTLTTEQQVNELTVRLGGYSVNSMNLYEYVSSMEGVTP